MNFKALKQELQISLEIWPKVVRRAWVWILLSLIFNLMMIVLGQLFPKDESLLFFSGVLLIFSLTLLYSTLGVIIVNQVASDVEKKEKTPLLSSLQTNFKFAMIESLRALAPIMVRWLLLIIPGIIESVRLYWLIYVVQFDEGYKKGEVDALERSRALVKGRVLKAMGVLLFVFALGMLPRLMGREDMLLTSPLRLAAVIFASVSLEVFGDIVLYRYYLRLTHGPEIQKS
jgi:hypothetical protein